MVFFGNGPWKLPLGEQDSDSSLPGPNYLHNEFYWRMVTRFWKCYVGRRGYREGGWGLLIAILAALYPILSHLRAKLEPK